MATSTSEMINFRVKKQDVDRLNLAVKASGMSRSEFLRQAVSKEVGRYTGDKTPITAAPGRGPEAEKPSVRMPFEACPKAAQCSIKKLPTGVRLCTTCNVKM